LGGSLFLKEPYKNNGYYNYSPSSNTAQHYIR
jgi:hypothetical protein